MKHIEHLPAQLNLARVLLEVRQSDGTVRSSLARSLHLSFATVSNLSKVLEQNGYIVSDELRESAGGRRAAQIRFNPTARYTLGLLIEHDLRVRLALMDLDNTVVEELVIEASTVATVDELIDLIAERHRQQLERHGIDRSIVIGAGVAVPGVFNRTSGVVQATTSSALANLNLKDRLESALGYPCHLHNDADMAALAFSIAPEQDVENFLLIYFTEGIGLGIVINGDVYVGHTGFAGEIGHTRWGYDPLGENGSASAELKRLVSVQSILAEYFNKPLESDEFRHDWLRLMDELRRHHGDGEARAIELLRRTGRLVGQLVGTLADIFDPGVVAIGGRIQSILPVWLPIIREQARSSSYLARHRDLMITEARDVDAYILAGCGETAFQEWLKSSEIATRPLQRT